ncbi:bifunctional helix-turn-helix transcriptional regulator/GNAT family N-acetyltransferase [Sedimenticola selenatireducens]|uniref:MarR family transcriptional regulator n=1 Tax=Sedimenticola selenatireducens TaxID=191960 RepID=A0A557S219_9GAMM|nr:helix-turn-helix domain-containing GNAT family N-acetyltransferase [Sedimenticola selenatireducens]TVO71472.1 MarR family transcriptional regulator [Sedimenticola selenatireducens]TVT66161.1 MAG: MarR family transcriptional regulator [Sedimenticola selenatireducens]
MKQIADSLDEIDQIRAFNRFYTRHIGILDEGFLGQALNLPEIRVLFEVAKESTLTATTLADYLRMDPGYVSRILAKLLRQSLLQKTTDPTDRRRKRLTLSPAGLTTLQALDGLARDNLDQLLKPLLMHQRRELVDAMHRIMDLLEPTRKRSVLIRPLQLGDISTVINRHAVLYATEYQWDKSFERTVLEVLASFANNYDETCERGWIAEVDGRFAGSIFAVKEDTETARLRALLVEPEFRGMQIGRQLIQQCIDFCRQCGYKKMTLWTCSCLTQARKLYTKSGFTCTKAWDEHIFGADLTSESWDKVL